MFNLLKINKKQIINIFINKKSLFLQSKRYINIKDNIGLFGINNLVKPNDFLILTDVYLNNKNRKLKKILK